MHLEPMVCADRPGNSHESARERKVRYGGIAWRNEGAAGSLITKSTFADDEVTDTDMWL